MKSMAPSTTSTETASTTTSSQPTLSSKGPKLAPVDPKFTEEYIPPGEPKATWWRQLSIGTYWIRCRVPAKGVGGQVLFFGTKDIVPDEKYGATFPRQKGDAAIWQFSGNTTRGILMAAMKEQGIRVIMEADDNYTMPTDGLTGGWVRDIDRKNDAHSYEAHMRLCKWVDAITVSTENLASYYTKLNKNVYVCPNALDPDDWDFPDQKPHDGILRIGWAGSHSHVVDAPLVQKAFKWAAEQPNVEVWVFGIGEIAKFPHRVKKAPWTDDQDEYRRLLSTCDVHVCPLYETPWSAGKSDWKAMDAAAGHAWPIVSSATAYHPWHDKTMVCTTERDWLEAMKWVVTHRDEIPALAKEAREYVWSKRLIQQNAHYWQEAIKG